jgi:hypothetical protein
MQKYETHNVYEKFYPFKTLSTLSHAQDTCRGRACSHMRSERTKSLDDSPPYRNPMGIE